MSAGLVLDCSIAAAWCFEDEADAASDKLMDRVRDQGGLVPALWHWEVANVLTTAVRRKRIAPADASARLQLLGILPIATDADALAHAWRESFALAQAQGLTAYDAAYLELAARCRLPLATKDADLRDAAAKIGVKVLP